MSTNPLYDSLFNGEDFNIYEDLIEESIQNKGRDFYYLPRTLENFDTFFGEDSSPSSFNDVAILEMYMMNTDEWTGDKSFISKFDLDIEDNASILISKRRFLQEVTSLFPNIKRPREGDIIVFPKAYDNRIRAFEIQFVDNESVFYFLGNLPTFKLTVKNFTYSGESFETGIDSLDSYSNQWSIKETHAVTNIVGSFSINETITSANWTANLLDIDNDSITINNVIGIIKDGDIIAGSASNATAAIGINPTIEIDDSVQIDNNEDLEFASINIIG